MDNGYLTRRAAVEVIRNETGIPLTYSRLMKDGMRGVAPRPVAKFGRMELYTREAVLSYAHSLLKPVESPEDAASPEAA